MFVRFMLIFSCTLLIQAEAFAADQEESFTLSSRVGRCSLANGDCEQLEDHLKIEITQEAQARCKPLAARRVSEFSVRWKLARMTFDYPYDVRVSAQFLCKMF